MAQREGIPEAPGGSGNGGQRADVKVRVPEQVAGGVYANTMMVQHTRSEFIMDFALIVGGGGQVVARVVTSPTHMKRIIEALTDNMRKYESAHGPVEPRARA